jgi:Mitochondrial carrier protein
MTPSHDIVCSTRESLIVVFEPAEQMEYLVSIVVWASRYFVMFPVLLLISVRIHQVIPIQPQICSHLISNLPVTYEGLKRVIQAMKKDPENNPLSSLELLMAGGLAGFGAWIPAYPQDVIKSRLQNDLR